MFIALFNDVAPTFQDLFSENGQFKSKNLIKSFNNISDNENLDLTPG